MTTNEGRGSGRLSAVHTRPRLEGGFEIGVVAKRTYSVDGSRCVLAPAQAPLVEEPLVDEPTGALLHDTDLILHRELVDIIVEGKVRVARPAPTFEVALCIGDFRRNFIIVGERRAWLDSMGHVRMSPPEPIQEVALSWENAYGGIDQVGLQEIGDPFMQIGRDIGHEVAPTQSLFAYPRNPFGRGYVIEGSAAALAACRLPLVENPRSLVTCENLVREHFVTWPSAPMPASAGWLSYFAFPRSAHLGLEVPLFDELRFPGPSFPEVAAGLVRPEDLEAERGALKRLQPARAAQCAAVEMRARHVAPGAPVRLVNVHPYSSEWLFHLPADIPRMACRLPGQGLCELAPAIHELVINLDESLVTVLWVGRREMDRPLTPKELEELQHGVVWR